MGLHQSEHIGELWIYQIYYAISMILEKWVNYAGFGKLPKDNDGTSMTIDEVLENAIGN
ncbi:MAG: hypothetical protein CM15mV14_1480 [uncultured marine virus]|nr:MAG: hypothetical protein CM15mV14_1480 [uncultured marine virus]